MVSDRERGIPRRQFVRSAVAIGGASALSACLGREGSLLGGDDDNTQTPEEGDAATEKPTFPSGVTDPDMLAVG
jgi:hypothetical protein